MRHAMRRSDREIPYSEAREILKKAEFGVLSTISPDNEPYGVPLNFCLIDDTIYFHCATEGRKLANIAHESRVSFCAVGRTEVLPEKFTTRYESTIITGIAGEAFDDEKQRALEGLIRKYSPDFIDEGSTYIEKLTHKTAIYRITIESMSGKARR